MHRPSSSTTTTPLAVAAARHAPGRTHSHSVSLGTWNSSHRVTRRKSMTSNNFAALAARGGLDGAFLDALAAPATGRRRPVSVQPGAILRPDNATPSASMGGADLTSSTVKPEGPIGAAFGPDAASAVVDGGRPLSEGGPLVGSGKPRNRRASDGAHLAKTEGKRSSGVELRCDKCGKGYKHSSCLTKHLSVLPRVPLPCHVPQWRGPSVS